MKGLDGLDEDLKQSAFAQLRELWTHNSTAIEGNTLSLAETHFVLSEGLTVKGKPVKDHNEVIGHSRAIDLLYSLLGRDLLAEDIFELHRAIQTEVVVDYLRPNGDWKREANGTYGINSSGQRCFIEFALPSDVPDLMASWIDSVNAITSDSSLDVLLGHYTRLHIQFTAIHPFWDGNGRLARLLSNLPLIKAGYLPLVILNQHRQEYIAALNEFSFSTERPSGDLFSWFSHASAYTQFSNFILEEYSYTQSIIDEAVAIQQSR